MKAALVLLPALFGSAFAMAQNTQAPATEALPYKLSAGVMAGSTLMNSEVGAGISFLESHYLDFEFTKAFDMFSADAHFTLMNADKDYNVSNGATKIDEAHVTIFHPIGVGFSAGIKVYSDTYIFDEAAIAGNAGVGAFYKYNTTDREFLGGVFYGDATSATQYRPMAIGGYAQFGLIRAVASYGLENEIGTNQASRASVNIIRVGGRYDTGDDKLVAEAYYNLQSAGKAKTLKADDKKVGVYSTDADIADTEHSKTKIEVNVDGYTSMFGIANILKSNDTFTYHVSFANISANGKAPDPKDLTKLIDYKPSNNNIAIGGGWRLEGFYTNLTFAIDMASDFFAPKALGLNGGNYYVNGSDKTQKNIDKATDLPIGGLAITDDDGKAKTRNSLVWKMGFDF